MQTRILIDSKYLKISLSLIMLASRPIVGYLRVASLCVMADTGDYGLARQRVSVIDPRRAAMCSSAASSLSVQPTRLRLKPL